MVFFAAPKSTASPRSGKSSFFLPALGLKAHFIMPYAPSANIDANGLSAGVALVADSVAGAVSAAGVAVALKAGKFCCWPWNWL